MAKRKGDQQRLQPKKKNKKNSKADPTGGLVAGAVASSQSKRKNS